MVFQISDKGKQMALNWISKVLRNEGPGSMLDYSDGHLGYDGALRPDVIGFLTEHSNCAYAPGLIIHDVSLDEHELAIG